MCLYYKICTYFLITISALITIQEVNAEYELTVIKAVSTSRRTFVTQHGREEGIIEGQRVSFTTENVSYIVRAKVVSRVFTVWEVIEPGAMIPFNKDNIVLMNTTISHSEIMDRTKKYFTQERLRKRIAHSYILRSSMGRSVFQAVSGTDNALKPVAYFVQFEGMYQRTLYKDFEFAVGLRFEYENTPLANITLISQRYYGLGEIIYNFPNILGPYETHIYMALTLGYGSSKTNVNTEIQQGNVMILPGAKIGFDYVLSNKYTLKFEGGMEAIGLNEVLYDQNRQDTTQINSKMGLALQTYF